GGGTADTGADGRGDDRTARVPCGEGCGRPVRRLGPDDGGEVTGRARSGRRCAWLPRGGVERGRRRDRRGLRCGVVTADDGLPGARGRRGEPRLVRPGRRRRGARDACGARRRGGRGEGLLDRRVVAGRAVGLLLGTVVARVGRRGGGRLLDGRRRDVRRAVGGGAVRGPVGCVDVLCRCGGRGGVGCRRGAGRTCGDGSRRAGHGRTGGRT